MQPNRRLYAMQAQLCRGLAHPVRLEVVHLLGNGEAGFGELLEQMRISKAKLSQHLAVLRTTGIVTARREGPRVFYRLRYPEIESACLAVGRALAQHLAEVQQDTNVLLQTVRGRRRSA